MSKKNLELATKIIEQRGDVKKNEQGNYWADLHTTFGMVLGSVKPKKADAVKDMAQQLAGELDAGNLVLSRTWEKDNLK